MYMSPCPLIQLYPIAVRFCPVLSDAIAPQLLEGADVCVQVLPPNKLS